MPQTLTHTVILPNGGSIVLTATVGDATVEVFKAWQAVVKAVEEARPTFEK